MIDLAMLENLTELAREKRISLRWLLTGQGSMHLTPTMENANKSDLLEALGRLALQEGGGAPSAEYRVARTVQPGFRIVEAEQLPQDWHGRFVPLIGRLAAGEGLDTEQADGTPPGWAFRFVEYAKAPPGGFAIEVVGDSMERPPNPGKSGLGTPEPSYHHGDLVIVDGDKPAREGICCVIEKRRGERVVRLKKLTLAGAQAVLESLNPAYPPARVAARDVEAYAIVAHLPWLLESPP